MNTEATDLRTYDRHRWIMDTGLALMRPTDPDGPPTLEPTFAEYMAYCADGALEELTVWWAKCLWPDRLHELAAVAGQLMTTNTIKAREIGIAVQAGREAMRDIAEDDARTFVIEGARAVHAALHSRIASVDASRVEEWA